MANTSKHKLTINDNDRLPISTKGSNNTEGQYKTIEELTNYILAQVPASTPPYTEYIALITQSGTADPTAIVMNSGVSNFLGNIVWTRTDIGTYEGALTGAFTQSKTDCSIQLTVDSVGSEAYISRAGANAIRLVTSTSGTPADDILQKTTIRIFVHE